MEIVTFETAKRLKEAGFPQPEFGNTQFWWILDKGEWMPTVIILAGGMQEEIVGLYPNRVFAPSATDILRVLNSSKKHKYSLVFESGLFHIECTYKSIGEFPKRISSHVNPAEAAALAWLEINEKQPA